LVFLSSDNDDNNVIRKQGKVRDIYNTKEYVIIVATDRQSAFDRNLAGVPFKVSPLSVSLSLSPDNA
jgi:phosphoribosylaminoimidazole-succinocarboxamide synthase